LFLDRDGVINVDHGYVHKPEKFEFIDGIVELVAAANARGYLVVVVTNQAGIGRGYYTETDFHALMAWVREQFSNRGAHIDAVYFSPFHPEHGMGRYRRDSDCRKPAPGMLLRAKEELHIDLAHSILIGDKPSDMQAGQAAGVGMLLHFCPDAAEGPGVTLNALADAVAYLRSDRG
jgi:D-glycero-D-manno-heptose 1,7-bisphosphate phosphatase